MQQLHTNQSSAHLQAALSKASAYRKGELEHLLIFWRRRVRDQGHLATAAIALCARLEADAGCQVLPGRARLHALSAAVWWPRVLHSGVIAPLTPADSGRLVTALQSSQQEHLQYYEYSYNAWTS